MLTSYVAQDDVAISRNGVGPCDEGCRLDSEDAYGSLWAAQRYNYTVAIVIVLVYQSKDTTVTAAIFEHPNRTEAFQSASQSVTKLHEYRRGVLVVDGESTSMLGTVL